VTDRRVPTDPSRSRGLDSATAFDPSEYQNGDRVLLQYVAPEGQLPAKLDGKWATVIRGPIPGSTRIRVAADSETDYPRNIEPAEIRQVEREGATIAQRMRRPGSLSLLKVEKVRA